MQRRSLVEVVRDAALCVWSTVAAVLVALAGVNWGGGGGVGTWFDTQAAVVPLLLVVVLVAALSWCVLVLVLVRAFSFCRCVFDCVCMCGLQRYYRHVSSPPCWRVL